MHSSEIDARAPLGVQLGERFARANATVSEGHSGDRRVQQGFNAGVDLDSLRHFQDPGAHPLLAGRPMSLRARRLYARAGGAPVADASPAMQRLGPVCTAAAVRSASVASFRDVRTGGVNDDVEFSASSSYGHNVIAQPAARARGGLDGSKADSASESD